MASYDAPVPLLPVILPAIAPQQGMFWRTEGALGSPIEELLSRVDFTVKDLLQEDDLIQECKALNPRLCEYLKTDKAVESLVDHVIHGGAQDAATACEVISCEMDDLHTTLLSHQRGNLFLRLLSLLETEQELAPSLSGRFTQAISNVLFRRGTECADVLARKEDLAGCLLRHISNPSVAELASRFACAGEWVGSSAEGAGHPLRDALVPRLVDLLVPTAPDHIRLNASEVLTCIARCPRTSPLFGELANHSLASKLLGLALPHAQPESGSTEALEVVVALLDPRQLFGAGSLTVPPPWEEGIDESEDGEEEISVVDSERPPEAIVEECAERSNEMTALLRSRMANNCVGSKRLKVAESVASLVRWGSERAHARVLESELLEAMLDAFFKFAFSTSLQHAVERAVVCCLDLGDGPLTERLLEKCDLPGRLARAPREFGNSRAGYMGHVVRMADRVEGSFPDRLEERPGWSEFAHGELAHVREASDTSNWGCGRPPSFDELLENECGDHALGVENFPAFSTDMSWYQDIEAKESSLIYEINGDDDQGAQAIPEDDEVLQLSSDSDSGSSGSGDNGEEVNEDLHPDDFSPSRFWHTHPWSASPGANGEGEADYEERADSSEDADFNAFTYWRVNPFSF